MRTYTFKAWARKANTNNEFVTTEIKATNKNSAKKWFIDNGYELDSEPYRA